MRGHVGELTDEEGELADKISDAVDANREQTFSPSELARKVRATTQAVHNVLPWMVRNQYVIEHGNGAWRRYGYRQFGKYNAEYLGGGR